MRRVHNDTGKVMTTIRAFFAIDLPLETQEVIRELLEELKTKHPHDSIRWSKPQNLHITLQFLAALKLEDIPTLTSLVKEEINQIKPFEIELGNLELFPNAHHPRVISMQVGPQELLADLSARIGKKILAAGYDIEKRAFRGHLTLARLRNNFSLEQITLQKLKPLSVKVIRLYQSKPSIHGSEYILLNTFNLSL
jgi:2'-5' RNA ligase